MLYLDFEGFTDINSNENQTNDEITIKTNSVVGFGYDGGRFYANVDGVELYNNMIADDDFGLEIQQTSERQKKNQGVVATIQDFESKDKERIQSEPGISIDGNSIIIFSYDKNRLEIYIDGELVVKTTASNDFCVDIYNV